MCTEVAIKHYHHHHHVNGKCAILLLMATFVHREQRKRIEINDKNGHKTSIIIFCKISPLTCHAADPFFTFLVASGNIG